MNIVCTHPVQHYFLTRGFTVLNVSWEFGWTNNLFRNKRTRGGGTWWGPSPSLFLNSRPLLLGDSDRHRFKILYLEGQVLQHRDIGCHTADQRLITYPVVKHWGRDKMDAISQTTFLSAFSWMKMFEFRSKFHWSLFLRVQLTIFQHWFR